jgi:hypothetical protein
MVTDAQNVITSTSKTTLTSAFTELESHVTSSSVYTMRDKTTNRRLVDITPRPFQGLVSTVSNGLSTYSGKSTLLSSKHTLHDLSEKLDRCKRLETAIRHVVSNTHTQLSTDVSNFQKITNILIKNKLYDGDVMTAITNKYGENSVEVTKINKVKSDARVLYERIAKNRCYLGSLLGNVSSPPCSPESSTPEYPPRAQKFLTDCGVGYAPAAVTPITDTDSSCVSDFTFNLPNIECTYSNLTKYINGAMGAYMKEHKTFREHVAASSSAYSTAWKGQQHALHMQTSGFIYCDKLREFSIYDVSESGKALTSDGKATAQLQGEAYDAGLFPIAIAIAEENADIEDADIVSAVDSAKVDSYDAFDYDYIYSDDWRNNDNIIILNTSIISYNDLYYMLILNTTGAIVASDLYTNIDTYVDNGNDAKHSQGYLLSNHCNTALVELTRL